uniref:Mitochondrial translation elongation factor G n=1 Tax=Tanacetum cinerariifolium TaxID=118510 RepID=A0A699IDU5_TANCI|nr:mitochondrial translation elongation factor G [Tanacetum cinerariifolium]GEZ53187.1 mitochondrial translation elongation factor G [Tanacetum cinerariifolium]
MFNPKSLLDAYHLAKWQESLNDIMRKNSNTSLSSSSKIDHSKEVKEDKIELEFRGDGKDNEGQSSGEEINKFGIKVLEVPYEETIEGIGMKLKESVELDGNNMEMDGKCLEGIDDFVNKDYKIEENKNEIGIKSRKLTELVDKNMNKVSFDISKDVDTWETFSNDTKIDSKDWVACDSNCEESEIFITSNKLESHTLVELSKERNKDDKSALIRVTEDEDCGLVGKFSSDLRVKFDCVGLIFVEASTVVEKHKASVTNIKRDTTYDILINQ